MFDNQILLKTLNDLRDKNKLPIATANFTNATNLSTQHCSGCETKAVTFLRNIFTPLSNILSKHFAETLTNLPSFNLCEPCERIYVETLWGVAKKSTENNSDSNIKYTHDGFLISKASTHNSIIEEITTIPRDVVNYKKYPINAVLVLKVTYSKNSKDLKLEHVRFIDDINNNLSIINNDENNPKFTLNIEISAISLAATLLTLKRQKPTQHVSHINSNLNNAQTGLQLRYCLASFPDFTTVSKEQQRYPWITTGNKLIAFCSADGLFFNKMENKLKTHRKKNTNADLYFLEQEIQALESRIVEFTNKFPQTLRSTIAHFTGEKPFITRIRNPALKLTANNSRPHSSISGFKRKASDGSNLAKNCEHPFSSHSDLQLPSIKTWFDTSSLLSDSHASFFNNSEHKHRKFSETKNNENNENLAFDRNYSIYPS
ncbi:MAG: hypothetical protein Tsb005_04230 [Gammaproteobacteria bacterium]